MLLGRRDLGDQAVAEVVPGVDLVVAQRDRHAEDAPLPGRLEDQLAVLARHGQVVAEVLDALGRSSSLRRVSRGRAGRCAGAPTLATPIMASRVTSAASSSSVSPSVPAGRSGSTM